MIWTTWKDFFAMGGYAFYVWGALLPVLLLLALELLALRWRRRGAETDVLDFIRAEGGRRRP